jgi:hypothetical protein
MNNDKIEARTRHILNLSGGKDSTALAVFMRKNYADLQLEYLFCDTGKELDETYAYLNQIEASLGIKIIRLNSEASFDHWWKVFGGYLPSPQMRWCTKLLKLKPFEAYVGDDRVVSYVGLRADEDRIGYISTKENIRAVFPFKEHGINYAGVIKLLEESGLGMPPYSAWGRTHSGCYFCFFQQPIEWVRLLETHPEQFDQAQAYEKINDDPGKTFTWSQGMSLRELRKPENVAAIKARHAERIDRVKLKRGDRKLIETFGDLELEDDTPKACLICQL